MAEIARVDGANTIDWVVIGDSVQWCVDTHGGVWYDISGFPGVGKGWTTSDGGQTWDEPVVAPKPPTYRTALSASEWIDTFSDDEWDWIDTKANTEPRTAATKALRKMMAAIDRLDAVNVAAEGMDQFYTWLLNNGIPGGQTRIDELRQGILEG